MPTTHNALAAIEPHLLTAEAFAADSVAVALFNHGRRWDVRYGACLSAFSDKATASEAIADVHAALVNNALYLNLHPIGDSKPAMPPAEVLAQYPEVVALYPELAMPKERFDVRKSPSLKKPWLVEDTHSNPAEDPVLYHFTSKKKAEAFKAAMVAEHAN